MFSIEEPVKNTYLPHVTGNFLTCLEADSNPGLIVFSVIGAALFVHYP